ERCLAPPAIAFCRLLADETLDVGIASVRKHPACRHEGVDPRGGVAIGTTGDVDQRAQLLLAQLREVGGALQRADARADARRGERACNRFGRLCEARIRPEIASVEAARVTGLGQKLLRLLWIVGVGWHRPREIV